MSLWIVSRADPHIPQLDCRWVPASVRHTEVEAVYRSVPTDARYRTTKLSVSAITPSA